MSGVLSLPLFPTMGICFLLLGNELYDRRLWRCRSAADVADHGSGGKHHGRADVRVLRQLAVRHSDSARRARGAVLTYTRESGYRASIDAKRFEPQAMIRPFALSPVVEWIDVPRSVPAGVNH